MSHSDSTPSHREGHKQKHIWSVGTLTYTTAGLVVLACWLLWGDFAWSMKERSVTKIVNLLLKKFHASDFVNGLLILSLPAAVTLFLAPVISYHSDRHRGRWGRRIPYLLAATPFMFLSITGLAFAPWLGMRLHSALGGGATGAETSIIVVIGLLWTLFEFSTIASNAVFQALVNDVVPQAVIGRFFGMFRALSLIVGIGFNYWIFGQAAEHFQWIFLGIGILYGVGFTIMCLKVKEGQYPAPPPVTKVHGKTGGFLPAAASYLKACFGQSYYLLYFAGVALATISLAPVTTYDLRYAASLGMSDHQYGACIALTYLVSLLLAYPLGALADRIHPLRVTIIAMGLYAATAFWGGFFARNVATFSIALVAHGIISGIFLTAVSSLPQKILPRSRFAELFSAFSILYSACSISLPFVVGPFLDSTGHVYRYTFLIGGGLAALSMVLLLILHSRFMALGGPGNYVPPDLDAEPVP